MNVQRIKAVHGGEAVRTTTLEAEVPSAVPPELRKWFVTQSKTIQARFLAELDAGAARKEG